MPAAVLGLDIGGANLKAVHTAGSVVHEPFELWRQPNRLREELQALIGRLPPADLLAVTMTGELCDCFPTRRAGVRHILDAVEQATTVPARIWLTTGRFASLEEARRQPILAAASNWLALATWVGRLVPRGPALLLDIGSTTTDIIPLLDGVPVPVGRTDPERLRSGELVYLGARRTPIMALLGTEGAAEFFATTLDVYLVSGQIPEDATDLSTADGRPATRVHALARLARMLCSDLDDLGTSEIQQLAKRLESLQVERTTGAVRRVLERLPALPNATVIAGSGEFLAARVCAAVGCTGSAPLSLGETLGTARSKAACAHAVAVLAAEGTHDSP